MFIMCCTGCMKGIKSDPKNKNKQTTVQKKY